MKKLILPLVIIMFLLTGCSIKQINNLTINEIVDYGLSINDSKANKSLKGYKIYLPNDMTIINDEKENNVFYKHGKSDTKLHSLWRSMIGRCYNTNNKN